MFGEAESLLKIIQTCIGLGKRSHVQVPVNRFKQLLKEHDFAIAQLPSILPENLKRPISAYSSDASIAEHLSDELIQWISTRFNVRREWLEGADNEIYDAPYYGHPRPEKLFEKLDKIISWDELIRLSVFSTDELLPSSNAWVWLSFEIPFFRDRPEDDHVTYMPLADRWNWSYVNVQKCLIRIAELFTERSGVSVPVYIVPRSTIERMFSCEIIPNTQHLKKYKCSGVYLDSYLRPEVDWKAMEREKREGKNNLLKCLMK